MPKAGNESVVRSPGEVLITDLLAVVERKKEEGESGARFSLEWAGTTILARITEDSPVLITKVGHVYGGLGGRASSGVSVQYTGAVGEILHVSAAGGGSIKLDNRMRIDLPDSGPEPLSAGELGLDIEVLDIHAKSRQEVLGE